MALHAVGRCRRSPHRWRSSSSERALSPARSASHSDWVAVSSWFRCSRSALGFPLKSAAAISLATVIATSSAVTARRTGNQLINLRFGMVLEVATTIGSLLGGITAQFVAETLLQRLFGVVAIAVAFVMLSRINRRNVIADPAADPGRLGGRFYEEESGGIVTYRIRRLPLALFASFIAGNVSSLLGIGGGIIKVPVLNAWCGMPLRAAAATSALMIGVTATGGAIIYYGRGDLQSAARGAGRPRRSTRVVGGTATRPGCVGEVAEGPDGGAPRRRRRADVRAGACDEPRHVAARVTADRSANARLEVMIGEVLRFGTIASSTLLAIGLAMTLARYRSELARLLARSGIDHPDRHARDRVVVSVIEYIRERDWLFVVLTLVVLAALGGSVVAAYLQVRPPTRAPSLSKVRAARFAAITPLMASPCAWSAS